MEIIQRKTGRHLGSCSIPQNTGGRKVRIAYRYENGTITTTHFRFGELHNSTKDEWELCIIAHGYRDAAMLPDFKPTCSVPCIL